MNLAKKLQKTKIIRWNQVIPADFWLREEDLNLRPPGYEPDELPTALPRDMVPETGVEPARDCSHGILSPGRLPIPPLRHLVWLQSLKCLLRIPQTKAPVKKNF